MIRKLVALMLVLSASVVPSSGAGNDSGFGTTPCRDTLSQTLPGSSGVVHRVPSQHASIQAAVNAASPGDTILVSPGVYRESVQVRTPALRIRGTSRHGVILDGGATPDVVGLEIGIDVTRADRVLVENVTAHNYERHGFYWHEVTGYWGRYLNAYDNGLYGIYALDARCGQLDHTYVSGNADSGLYIGECFPCDSVITDSVSEANGLGYSGTNAGGNLVLRDSLWINNGLGIVPNSLDGEDNPPQRSATIKNNQVIANNNRTAPGVSFSAQYYGGGIVIAGASANAVFGNTVLDHAIAGIVITPLPDKHVWIPSGNVVWGNTVQHDPAEHPNATDLAQAAGSGPNNCWERNIHGTAKPVVLQTVWACADAMATPPGGDPSIEAELVSGPLGLNGRDPLPWQTYPLPPAALQQPNQIDDDGNGDYADDGPADTWLPALGL